MVVCACFEKGEEDFCGDCVGDYLEGCPRCGRLFCEAKGSMGTTDGRRLCGNCAWWYHEFICHGPVIDDPTGYFQEEIDFIKKRCP